MRELSPAIAERSRKNASAILRGLAGTGQARVAELTGVSEATVSRFKDGGIDHAAALIAACGLKCVPDGVQCFDPEYVRALKVMAGVGLESAEPKTLEW